MENVSDSENKAAMQLEHRRGKVLGGLFVVGVGVVLLLREAGVTFPDWLFNWEMILILIGIYTGIKHGFKNPSWLILMVIGGIFLADDLIDGYSIEQYIWPLLLIVFGIWIMLKPQKKCHRGPHWERWQHKWKDKWEWENAQGQKDSSDFIESVSVFGALRKHVLSKQFKGGEVTCVFGGMEVNLMQADFNGTAVIEVTQVFGGAKLIVPAHWEIHHHELVAVMGGIDDKRQPVIDSNSTQSRILVLKGTCIFGGIEIKSYS